MKTETTMPAYESPLKVSQKPLAIINDKTHLRAVRKSDVANHHFSQHNNQSVQKSSNWDDAWFASYE